MTFPRTFSRKCGRHELFLRQKGADNLFFYDLLNSLPNNFCTFHYLVSRWKNKNLTQGAQSKTFLREENAPLQYPRSTCVGCAIVQADNAPDCGVAQGVIHGVSVRHDEKKKEEESEVEQEVESQEEENAQTPVRMSMDEMEVTRHGRGLEPM